MTSEKDMKITAKQNKFAELIALGKTQYESYLTAYPISKGWKRNSVDRMAFELLKNIKIISRIDELRKKAEEKYNVTRDSLVKEINDAQEMSVIKKNGNAFLRAIELKAKITGNMIERQEINEKVELTINYSK